MSVIDFIEEIKAIRLKKLFFIEHPIELCELPYPGHKKGCPNIIKNLDRKIPFCKKNKNCPPYAKRLSEKYNLYNYNKYFLYVKFNIKKQEEKMKKLHPNWTDKQCKCLLYWQGSIRKTLKERCINFTIDEFIYSSDKYNYELIPEAMGLDVFKTMSYYGIELERNPINYVYKIAFIGVLCNKWL